MCTVCTADPTGFRSQTIVLKSPLHISSFALLLVLGAFFFFEAGPLQPLNTGHNVSSVSLVGNLLVV
jgi:hypothetical protein